MIIWITTILEEIKVPEIVVAEELFLSGCRSRIVHKSSHHKKSVTWLPLFVQPKNIEK